MRSEIDFDYRVFRYSGQGSPYLKWSFPDWRSEWSFAQGKLDQHPEIEDFRSRVSEALSRRGYLVLKLGSSLITDKEAPFLVTRMLSVLGAPIRIFDKEPGHWRVVDVDLKRPPSRSRGSGFLPLHMDFVNAENPPELVCLLCIREDPRGGGNSLIARHRGVENEIDPQSYQRLMKVTFYDGEVSNLLNIGKDVNPFSIFSPGEDWNFRYTGHLNSTSGDEKTSAALKELSAVLASRAESFPLTPGEMLIVDQREALHGREPVGGSQDRLGPEARRLLLHSFVRRNLING